MLFTQPIVHNKFNQGLPRDVHCPEQTVNTEYNEASLITKNSFSYLNKILSLKILTAGKEETPPVCHTPRKPSSLAWDKVRNNSGDAAHPLCSDRKAVHRG